METRQAANKIPICLVYLVSMTPTARPADIAALLPRLRRFARGIACKREDADGLVPIGTLTSRVARARPALQGFLSDQARTIS